jgi:hypothetical protein
MDAHGADRVVFVSFARWAGHDLAVRPVAGRVIAREQADATVAVAEIRSSEEQGLRRGQGAAIGIEAEGRREQQLGPEVLRHLEIDLPAAARRVEPQDLRPLAVSRRAAVPRVARIHPEARGGVEPALVRHEMQDLRTRGELAGLVDAAGGVGTLPSRCQLFARHRAARARRGRAVSG